MPPWLDSGECERCLDVSYSLTTSPLLQPNCKMLSIQERTTHIWRALQANLPYEFAGPFGRQRLSSKALLITLTELMAIAAPATTGLRKPSAASGMPATL